MKQEEDNAMQEDKPEKSRGKQQEFQKTRRLRQSKLKINSKDVMRNEECDGRMKMQRREGRERQRSMFLYRPYGLGTAYFFNELLGCEPSPLLTA